MDEEYFIFLNFPHNFSQDLRQGSDLENFSSMTSRPVQNPFALTPKQSLNKVQLVAFGLKQDFPDTT